MSVEEDMLETPGTLFQQKFCERERKKRQSLERSKSSYNPAIKKAIKNCIGGSAAESERVWSMAGRVLNEHPSSLSPLVFELIMYLKYNSRLWDLADVVNANKRRRNDSRAAIKRIAVQNERLVKWKKEISDWDKEVGERMIVKKLNIKRWKGLKIVRRTEEGILFN